MLRMKRADWDEVIATNLTATFALCQAAIKPMIRQRAGRIVAISSVVGQMGNAGQANYAASKAGVVGLTRTLALELARNNITVNCVAPGATNTQMVAKIPDDVRAGLIGRIPLKRMAEPADIAALHAFLASDDAGYITGQVIFCDGGVSVGA